MGLQQFGIFGRHGILNRYTDGNVVYEINIYSVGKLESLRTDIDDYIMMSDSYLIVAVPMFQSTTATREAQTDLAKFQKDTNFMRLEASEEDFNKFVNLVEKHKECLEPVTFEYLSQQGIKTDRDAVRYELRPLATCLTSGNTAYKIVAIVDDLKNPKCHYIHELNERKMPLSLWKQVKPLMEYFTERNDLFDPMEEVRTGTYYTFQKSEVEKILDDQKA
jgi:hypothetical protein